MCFMINIIEDNKYVLEIETEVCIFISIYDKSRKGLQKAFRKAEEVLIRKKIISARIFISDSKEEVWCNFRAN